MGVHIYSALDWDSEKGRNYMPALEAMAKQSASRKLALPTWYDFSPVLAFFHPLLKAPKLFLCGEEKSIDAVARKLAEKDVKFGPGFSGEDLLARFSSFLDELITSPPECWFNNIRCLEQKYSLHPLNMSATDMVSVSGLFFDSYRLNAYLTLRATDEYHRPDKKRKAYIRARLAGKEPAKPKRPGLVEKAREAPAVINTDSSDEPEIDIIDRDMERIKIMEQEYCRPVEIKAPEEISEDEYGDPTDDYGNPIRMDEIGCPVEESEEIREDEYDYPVPEEDSMDPVDEEGRPID